jgi:hypothetical protein
MSKALTVKVPTHKVIKALETKLATVKKEKEAEPALETKYQAAHDKWLDDVKKLAMANLSKGVNIRINVRTWNNTMNIDYDIPLDKIKLPEEPERNFTTMAEYVYKDTVEEITNALNVLRMTDELVVNASTSTYKERYDNRYSK